MLNRTGRYILNPVLLLILLAGQVYGQTCYAPERPFVPTDPQDVQEYRDLIGRDFETYICLLYTSPSPRDQRGSRMPSSA